ncbi:unnamed protein product [Chondrus crispus]|uniref:Uncharacterized protein n=1 Tax=Chondrus crispus TaxID=2769 RepID=R7Q3S8_CHOCR|nr:unnamed protein product [Chondrus crispus]CDF32508.1 unnamed protein product [Chondrus crispus]|eukprot:XP_005712173.1 unnamed protein product [Chondrus crispus]
MLSFALSGPAFLAAGLLTAGGLGLLFSFGEVGPRREVSSTFFFLRIQLPSAVNVEMPDGTTRRLREGESVLKLPTREACTAVTRRVPQEGLSYSVYKAGGENMRLVQRWPRPVNAKGGKWPQGVVQREDEGFLEARWEEYQRLGEGGDVDEEWKKVISQLGGVRIVQNGDCKLCGGTGLKRCYRCGGVGSTETFECDCQGGKRACEWCAAG